MKKRNAPAYNQTTAYSASAVRKQNALRVRRCSLSQNALCAAFFRVGKQCVSITNHAAIRFRGSGSFVSKSCCTPSMPFGLTFRSLCDKNHRSTTFLIFRAPFGNAAQAHSALYRIINDAARFCNTRILSAHTKPFSQNNPPPLRDLVRGEQQHAAATPEAHTLRTFVALFISISSSIQKRSRPCFAGSRR